MQTKTLPTRVQNRDPFGVFAENPLALFQRFSPAFERLFDPTPFQFAPRLRELPGAADWLPNIDVFERDGTFILRADLPGMTKDDVKVEVKDNAITIEGERKRDFEQEKDGIYRIERAYGFFYRAVPLPEGVKAGDVNATFKNGVLEVTAMLPGVAKEEKPLMVEIKEPPTKAKPAA